MCDPGAPGPRHAVGREGGKALPALIVHRHFAALAAGRAQVAVGAAHQPLLQPRGRARAAIRTRPRIVYYGSALTYAELRARRSTRWPATCSSAAACKRGDRVLLYMQNSPQFIIALLRHPARRRGGGAGQPDEPHARSCAHYVARLGRARRDRGAGAVRRDRAASWRKGARSTACWRRIRTTCDEPRPPAAGFRARAAPDPRAGSRQLWNEALARGLRPRAHAAGPTISPCCPTPRAPPAIPRAACYTHANLHGRPASAAALDADLAAKRCVLGVLPMFHVTGMQANMNIADPARRAPAC